MIVRGDVSAGAGTIAARSRAMATRSLITATAVASPPAPAPKTPMSPECAPVIDRGVLRRRSCARRSIRAARRPARPRRSTSIAPRSYSACASLANRAAARAAPRRSRAGRRVAAADRVVDRVGVDAQPERQRAQNRQLRARVARRRDRPTDPPRHTRARCAFASGLLHRAAASPPSGTDTAFVVPFRIATMRVMRSPASRRRSARTIGIAPPTAASNRSCRPCRAASVNSAARAARSPACWP